MEIKKSLKKCTFPKIVFQFETDEEATHFLENWNDKNNNTFTIDNSFIKSNKTPTEMMQITNEKVKNTKNYITGTEDVECYAVLVPIADIKTDPARFQNRTDAFSELSADSVAKNYDPNKFDPIVIWYDQEQNQLFVLSGHSRYEGLKRRGEKFIPARRFNGAEAEAITFARVDANRSANVENLVEDLKAYILTRDGDPQRHIKPAKKSDLARIFKGKHTKLEAYSHLNIYGLFIETLQNDNKSEFPFVESRAYWVGELRKKYEQLTNTMEDDCFNFFYGDVKNNKISKEDFFKEIEKRLAWGKPRLFPECTREGCSKIEDLNLKPPHGEQYQELNRIQKDLDTLKTRFNTNNAALQIYTEDEKKRLIQVNETLLNRQKNTRKSLNLVEAQEQEAGLFGVPEDVKLSFSGYFSKGTKDKIKVIFDNSWTKTYRKKETYFAILNSECIEYTRKKAIWKVTKFSKIRKIPNNYISI